ncbi:TPA: hypothetical protein ACXJEC_004797 [Serratia marcescens]
MKKISQFTGLYMLSAIYLVATAGKIDQLQGDILGSVLWGLAVILGGMWLIAQALGAIHKTLLKFD